MSIAFVGADRRVKGSLGPRWLLTAGLMPLLILLQSNSPCALAQGLFFFVNYEYFGGKPLFDEPIHVLDPATGACIRPFGDDWHAELLAAVPARGVGLTPLSPILEFASLLACPSRLAHRSRSSACPPWVRFHLRVLRPGCGLARIRSQAETEEGIESQKDTVDPEPAQLSLVDVLDELFVRPALKDPLRVGVGEAIEPDRVPVHTG
jgi:hypothetical protein